MGKIKQLRERLGEFESALFISGYNRNYFSGFKSSEGFLLVTPNSATLLVDFRYIEAAAKLAKDVDVVLATRPKQQIKELLEREGAKSVLLEREISLGQLFELREGIAGVEFSDGPALSAAAAALRQIKTPDEIEKIRAAQAITDAAFSEILNFIAAGKTEREIAARLEYEMRLLGADGLAFDTIAVGGPNSSRPHGVPGDRPLESGELLTLDFGALKDSYCSDMTRTVAIGEPGERQREVYELVLSAHLAAIGAARAGITGKQLDAVARDLITAAGYGESFGHGLGHSLGLEIHEDPRANTQWEKPLEAGVVMTIEPGVYLAGEFGVRIENMVLLTTAGCENLTNSARELLVL